MRRALKDKSLILLSVHSTSIVHESGTPDCELGYLGIFVDLGRTGFTGLTRVKARVHFISTRVDVKDKTKKL
jgi:hypothetical protein